MIISIHAPRRGSDGSSGFSPATAARFQSTLPVGGATKGGIASGKARRISIHAPRGGSDETIGSFVTGLQTFQSTLPVGGATLCRQGSLVGLPFQSTLPVGGATCLQLQIAIFQSTLPVGGATCPTARSQPVRWYFNPRSPWGERRASGRS